MFLGGDPAHGQDIGPIIDHTEICKFANVKLVELLESEDMHDYQKYLLLRYLFKGENDLTFDLSNYVFNSFPKETYAELVHQQQYVVELNPTIIETPFEKQIKGIVKNLGRNSESYPLKMICQELTK